MTEDLDLELLKDFTAASFELAVAKGISDIILDAVEEIRIEENGAFMCNDESVDLERFFELQEFINTCVGFPTPDCNRKPSNYYNLRDAWYCISCYNEMAAHYKD